MANVEIYTKSWCPFCTRAKSLLHKQGVAYHEIDVTTDGLGELEMIKRSRRFTVPQIFIDGHLLGGSDELLDAYRSGRLARLLSRELQGETT